MEYPRLPDWVMGQAEGRASTSEINDLANEPRNRTATVTANGAMLPIIYGEAEVAGLVFAVGKIGTDLVIGYIWGIGEVDSFADIFINDSVVDPSITVTHYTGTPTQGVDPTLAAAIVAYADTLRIDTPTGKRGIAYSVVRIPEGVLEGFPKARAVIKGRKIYNPLTSVTEWTDKPALCFADMVMDADYGLGSTITSGLQECIDWNDSLLGGVSPRARLSLVITEGKLVTDYLKLLGEYAECWYTFDGVGVKMSPDAPVDLDLVDTITPDKILKDSLSIVRRTSLDTPTEVEVRYTVPSGDATPWETDSITQSATGVESGDVVRIPTTLSLEGVYRLEEANNRALSKLNRVNDRLDISWTTFDSGIIRQIGDVVKISNPQRGLAILPVRITSVRLTTYGRYTIGAENYSPTHYPSEIDTGSDGVVPVGVIGLLQDDAVPVGWDLFTDADGKFIKGAGLSTPIGSTGGNDTFSGFSGTTGVSATHIGTTEFTVIDYQSGGSEYGFLPSFIEDVGHQHTFNSGAISPDLYRRDNKLVIKTGTPSLKIPKNIMTFGLDGIVDGDATRISYYAGRLLKSGSVNGNAGSLTEEVNLTTDSFDDTHTHGGNYFSGLLSTSTGSRVVKTYIYAGGFHTHQFTTELQRLVKKYPLALYGGVNDYSVKAGRMFLWSGDINSLPTDYVLVEAAEDRLLEFAGSTTPLPSGDNTLRIEENTTSVGHSHQGPSYIVNKETIQVPHSDTVFHNHNISETASWEPPYYTLAVIMYQPID